MPAAAWLGGYRRDDLPGDLIAGTVVAIMLVPQGMAYAMLAGLPPEVGLYASILPLIAYAAFGSSRTLAVGPVAIVSLMTASALGAIVPPGSSDYIAAALALAALSGLILLGLGLARLGFLVSFLSHPVIAGFTSAAALVIGLSQLKHLLGLDMPRGHPVVGTLGHAFGHLGDVNLAAAAIGFGAIALLLLWRGPLVGFLKRLGMGPAAAHLGKAGPLAAVVASSLAVWAFALDERAGVRIVGAIPAGLPPLTLPPLDWQLWGELLPAALLISFVGFLESVSVAKALASKRRQKIVANQELVGLGAANLAAGLTGGYPVTGGFSRSVVNFTAGAVTPLASVITAGLIAATLVLLTPLFHYLPNATLAAVIVVAVANLVDLRPLGDAWRYNKADAASLLLTFAVVLAIGIEEGIIAGVVLSLALYLWRTSRPHIAILGRVGDSEHFRNVLRHPVRTCPHVLALRVDASLYFANSAVLEQRVLAEVADNREVRHVVLVCSAVNFIDASALESLRDLTAELRDAGVTLHLAEIKGPVSDQLARTDFLERMAPGRVFLSTHEAMRHLDCV